MSGLRASLSVLLSTCVMLPLITTKAEGQTCQPQWLPGDGVAGVDGGVNVVTPWDPDGPGPLPELLVVGGSFKVAGGVVANNIACWDPATATWSTLGTGTNGSVSDLAVLDGKLYAGGSFTRAGGVIARGIACWDPTSSTWSSLILGVWKTTPSAAGIVSALTTMNGNLYAGGVFDGAGVVSAKNIACWDPATSTWSALGSGLDSVYNSCVMALAVLNNKLYAGGYFAGASIACWDPAAQTWSTLGSGVDRSVYALAVMDGKLYAGGNFFFAGGLTVFYIACWDPATSTWSSLGTGINNLSYTSVHALTVLNGRLYVGGDFYTAGGLTAYCIACWDPAASEWSSVGLGLYGPVRALTVLGGRLYSGGEFHAAGEGEVAVNRIACWDPTTSTWSGLSPGMGGEVYSFPVYVPGVAALTGLGGRVYAGGTFTTAGGMLMNRIASSDLATATWSNLNSGVAGVIYPEVLSLMSLDGKVYAGGYFAIAGTVAANHIAFWDPAIASWSALGSGVSGRVRVMRNLDGKLYLGGDFTTAGGIGANRIACWDPATSTWSALGSGMDGTVYALLTMDDKLYAGGLFTTAGGASANRIACWDPATSAWSALGSGMDNDVFALAVLDGKLYAGGSFTTAGGAGANRIACWDLATSTWSAVGAGMSGYTHPHTQCQVSALTIWDGRLYAGGEFTTAGGAAANYIASWDPVTSTWSALGTGMDSKVLALAVLEGTLYAGGEFYTAGGLVSAYMARWRTGPQADLDCDLDVDSDDLDTFEACATGPGVGYDPLPLGCSLTPDGQNPIAADFDGDGDVDQGDFAVFQRCLSGAEVLAELGCGS